MDNLGYIYIRNHISYKDYNIYKLGETKNLYLRDSTYSTGEYIRGSYILILKMLSKSSILIERILKNYFKNLNKRNSGGTEFFDNKIIDEITIFLDKQNIKYKKLDINQINKDFILNDIKNNKKIKHLIEKFIRNYKINKIKLNQYNYSNKENINNINNNHYNYSNIYSKDNKDNKDIINNTEFNNINTCYNYYNKKLNFNETILEDNIKISCQKKFSTDIKDDDLKKIISYCNSKLIKNYYKL
jgi:hypothetical protein